MNREIVFSQETREVRAFRPDRLPKPPALEAFLREWQSRGFRVVPEGIVPPEGMPLELEIGCGVGWHSIRRAKEAPHTVLIAVEKTREKFRKFQDRLERNAAKSVEGSPFGLSNLFPVHADAVSFTVHALPSEVLDRVFLFYPNPADKNPAERWFRMPYFGCLLGKLKKGGAIELRTNRLEYFEEARDLAIHVWGLDEVRARKFSKTEVAPQAAETHFERKYLERGDTCYELIVRKPGGGRV